MATAIQEKTLSPDEFMALKIEHAELIDGKVVEHMPPVFDHDELALAVGSALRSYVKQHRLGRVAGGGSFHTEAEKVRAPDVSFVSNADLEGENTAKYLEKPPTLAVEIISQNDTYDEVDDKASEFLRAGSKAVWIVNPRRRNVTVLTPDEGEILYKMGQSIPGGEILPGFELPVAQIFEE
jgi:Uma2 family endonuclease